MKKYQKKLGYGEQRIKIAYIFVAKISQIMKTTRFNSYGYFYFYFFSRKE